MPRYVPGIQIQILQHHLTTTLQPFCLNYLTNEKIIKYRKTCLGSNLVVADDNNIMDGGIIGRVFRNQLPEASSDLSFYSVAEYPQLELALSCGFNSILVLPVLEPSEKCCVCVLEILSTETINQYAHHLVHTINTMFKSAHLETIDAVQIRTQIRGVYSGVEESEIKAAAKAVCKTHNITLAFLWVRCAHHEESEISDYNVNCKGELLVLIPGMLFSSGNYVPDQYYASLGTPMNVGQGLVGKAALYRKPFFCRDVSQLSITQFPFVHCARRLRLKGCFAVCLRTISTRNHEYVVEFFLPRKGTYMRDHHKFLSSILTTMLPPLPLGYAPEGK